MGTVACANADAFMTEKTDRTLPPWLLGWGNLPLAINGSVGIIAVPDLLASAHVPEAQIATVTSLYLATAFIGIPITPILDWRYARRSYAIAFTLLCTVFTCASLLAVRNVGLLTIFLFLSGLTNVLVINAVGGWFGNLLPTEQKDALGAWFTIANFGGGGVAAAFSIFAMRHLPSPWGAIATSALILLVLPLYLLTPCPRADRKLAAESFRAFSSDVIAMFRRKEVQWILAIFLAPAASFALTNTLSGFGHNFHTSDEMVGLIGGSGVTIAGICGSLIVPQIAKRISPVAIYLLVGLIGASFTISLLPQARDAFTFGIAILGENLFQAAAFSAANAITLRTIGHDNPLAATQYGVLLGATQIPLTYMQVIDGNAYHLVGLTGTLLTDASISGLACLVLGTLYWQFGRKIAAV